MNEITNKILVTGGAGFIGSHVTDELIKNGYEVVVIDDLSGGFKENVNPKALFVEGDICNKDFVEQIFNDHNFSHVFHLAAYAAEGLSHFIKRFNYNNNLIGSVNLINASVNHGIKTFVFTSSIAVYGKNQLPMSEEMVPVPEDSYGIAKYSVELELKATHEMFGMNYVIFRPHNVYGERQNIGDKYRNVIGIFMNLAMQKQAFPIFGDGEQERAFSHISDVAPIIAQSIEIPEALNQVFNVGADTPYTVNMLAKEVSAAMRVSCEINYLPQRNEVKIAYADHSKVKSVFKPKEALDLKSGVEEMAKWAKDVGPRQSVKFSNIEIEKNLPPSWRA